MIDCPYNIAVVRRLHGVPNHVLRHGPGRKPVVAFLEGLQHTQPALHRHVLAGLDRLRSRASHGPPLTRQVDPDLGILELRVGNRDIARVFFFFQPDRLIVCTNGYVKKSQKLDPRELAWARHVKADWVARHRTGQG